MQWLTNGLKVFNSARGLAIAAGVGLVLLGSSFGAGYVLGGRNEARIQIKEVEKRVYVPVKEIQQVQVRNVERERDLQERLQQAQANANRLQDRLSRLPVNFCPVSNDAVGVLNEAIANGSTSGAPGQPAGETSTVTTSDLQRWSLNATVQYNDVSTRYNELIDWVEDELIKPQQQGNQQ